MTGTASDRTSEDLAMLEDAFRALSKRACDPSLTMAGGRLLKAESGRLISQMRALRKQKGLSFVGYGWVNEVIRRRPQP